MIRLGTPLMTGQQGILFTILTCKTFNHRCTQIHDCTIPEGKDRERYVSVEPAARVFKHPMPLTNANSVHLHSTRATPSNTHTHTHRLTTGHLHVYTLAQYKYIVSHISLEPQPLYTPSTYTITSPNAHALTKNAGKKE